MDSPPTPQHPAADEEVRELPLGTLPESTMAHIDLNPDLEMLEDENEQHTANTENENDDESDASGTNEGPGGFSEAQDHTEHPLSENFNKNENTGSNSKGNGSENDGENEDEINEISPHNNGHIYKLRSSVDQLDHSPITLAQQSKLINYVDAQLLAIQRRFVKSQADTSQPYPLLDLLRDTQSVVDLIWCSVSTRSKLFGQPEYMVSLLGNLEDYLLHYDLAEAQRELFGFFRILDQRISTLIDGYTYEGHTEKISQTLLVRLAPIVSRVRFLVVTKLGSTRERLAREVVESTDNEKARAELDRLELEVGNLLEGVLERLE